MKVDEHLNFALLVRQRGDFPKCDLYDFSKLDIRDGTIHIRVYQQDGSMQPMKLRDTPENRLYASWIQISDRI